MNKYQEALENLILNDKPCWYLKNCCKYDICNFKSTSCDDCEEYKNVKLLQELVDKATPKKVIIEKEEHDGTHYDEPYTETHLICPTCKSDECYNKYCPICGQALDWGD